MINHSPPSSPPLVGPKRLMVLGYVEEEMVKAVGSTHPLPINPDLWKIVEMFFKSWMVTWPLVWHTTLLSKYLHRKWG